MGSVPELIRKGESETVEFKESFGKDALETACAFANTRGGTILIGVTDAGVVLGAAAGEATTRDWVNQIAQGIGIHAAVRRVLVRGKPVFLVSVRESRIKPVLLHGRAYRRAGSTTRPMGTDDIARAAMASAGETWDELPEHRAAISDISLSRVREFARLANKMGRRPVPASTAPLELLRKLGLVRDRRPTRAAILLFGRDPQKYYGEAIVKAGRFRGETLIVDDREIEGTLFDQVEGVSGYFRERLETRFERTGAPRREVIWEYPLDALREAVVNAVCHRDYLSRAQTQVRIYDSELVVMNPGGLPGGLSVAALTEKHESLPRNRLIAKILYYAGLIERWGSGIAKMVGACSAAGLPAPVFDAGQGFSVSFKKPVVAGATRTPSFAGNSLHLPPNSLHLPPNSLHLPPNSLHLPGSP
ncbi:MAG: ATP-binding protein, partial [Elusimicrobiales bacterium]|nr:ATP-binding protein [Elusimicrobiales bacterium]